MKSDRTVRKFTWRSPVMLPQTISHYRIESVIEKLVYCCTSRIDTRFNVKCRKNYTMFVFCATIQKSVDVSSNCSTNRSPVAFIVKLLKENGKYSSEWKKKKKQQIMNYRDIIWLCVLNSLLAKCRLHKSYSTLTFSINMVHFSGEKTYKHTI